MFNPVSFFWGFVGVIFTRKSLLVVLAYADLVFQINRSLFWHFKFNFKETSIFLVDESDILFEEIDWFFDKSKFFLSTDNILTRDFGVLFKIFAGANLGNKAN